MDSITAWSSNETYLLDSNGHWEKVSKKKNNYPQIPLFSKKVCRQQLIQCSNMVCIGCPYDKFNDPGYTCQDRLRYDAWYYLKEYEDEENSD